MLHQYRVTKYDPYLRDVSGAYRSEDWTARSDIGKSFGGTVLTEERYLLVEDAYVEAATAFLQEAGVGTLQVVGLENTSGEGAAPVDGSLVQLDQVKAVLRSLLREKYWCKLEGKEAFIHVGWDYYMYIGVPVECTQAKAVARRLGLFPEAFRSPYHHAA